MSPVFCRIMDLKGQGCSSLRGDSVKTEKSNNLSVVSHAAEVANEIADFFLVTVFRDL